MATSTIPDPTQNAQPASTNDSLSSGPAGTLSANSPQMRATGASGKEFEGEVGLGGFEIPELTVAGKDIELSKEVESAGVKVTPTNVAIPQSAQKLGVVPVGAGPMSQSQPPAQNLPLTDDQIAQGLKQSTKTSWRWFAEWCVRKLKQLHIALKNAGGKMVRVTK